MAATIIKIQNITRNKTIETVIYNPYYNMTGLHSTTESLDIVLDFYNGDHIDISFSSRDLLNAFIADLDIAMTSGSGIVTLTNAGLVATTTTTSTTTTSTSTTTTTTVLPPP